MEVTGNGGGNADRLPGNHEVRQKWMNFRRGVRATGVFVRFAAAGTVAAVKGPG